MGKEQGQIFKLPSYCMSAYKWWTLLGGKIGSHVAAQKGSPGTLPGLRGDHA